MHEGENWSTCIRSSVINYEYGCWGIPLMDLSLTLPDPTIFISSRQLKPQSGVRMGRLTRSARALGPGPSTPATPPWSPRGLPVGHPFNGGSRPASQCESQPLNPWPHAIGADGFGLDPWPTSISRGCAVRPRGTCGPYIFKRSTHPLPFTFL